MTRVPIACSLTETGAWERIGEWRAFLSDHVDAAVSGDGGLRLRLRPTDTSLLGAVDLAGREKACCAFFTVAIEIEPDARWLRIGAPPEAAGVLAQFAALLPPALRRPAPA